MHFYRCLNELYSISTGSTYWASIKYTIFASWFSIHVLTDQNIICHPRRDCIHKRKLWTFVEYLKRLISRNINSFYQQDSNKTIGEIMLKIDKEIKFCHWNKTIDEMKNNRGVYIFQISAFIFLG